MAFRGVGLEKRRRLKFGRAPFFLRATQASTERVRRRCAAAPPAFLARHTASKRPCHAAVHALRALPSVSSFSRWPTGEIVPYLRFTARTPEPSVILLILSRCHHAEFHFLPGLVRTHVSVRVDLSQISTSLRCMMPYPHRPQ